MTRVVSGDELKYQAGFGNALASEAREGALPRDQNSPRQPRYGLHAEQINGTGFTVVRALNQRTWMYRLRPQIVDAPFRPTNLPRFAGHFTEGLASPEVMRFAPMPVPDAPTDFLSGITTFAGAGDPTLKRGLAIHLYAANQDMDRVFCNVDGDLVVVPERGRLAVLTELGWLAVAPGEIFVLPRGIRFRVKLEDGDARGFIAELFDGHPQLPERGPVGANGLADARHFLAPVAWFEDREEQTITVVKQGGDFFELAAPHSPFDVVAWHGNHVPYKYDLARFVSMWSASVDHPDPSILTVLTAPADTHGRNALDVAVFQRRWDATTGTFRPPYFHRNSAIEFNAVVKSPVKKGPFRPGAFTYTPYLTPHGVSARSIAAHQSLSDEEADQPVLLSPDSVWVQFESTYQLRVMPWMFDHPGRDASYLASFSGYVPGNVD